MPFFKAYGMVVIFDRLFIPQSNYFMPIFAGILWSEKENLAYLVNLSAY
jgi:hypothetical protein